MRRRQGFTITELLVAFALIMFIMVILTEAFSAGLESFRHLKAIGDMQEKLRAAIILMRRDLRAEHFENRDNRGNKLSDIDLRVDPATNLSRGSPPDEGYFRIWQRSYYNDINPTSFTWNSTRDSISTSAPAPSSREGVDVDNIPTTISTDHVLSFTVKLKGTLPSEYMSALLPGLNPGGLTPPPEQVLTTPPQVPLDVARANTMNTQWGEVVYFLHRKPGRTANGTQLYALYRRLKLLAHPGVVADLTPANEYVNVSLSSNPGATPGTFRVNTPATITEPRQRFGANPNPMIWEGPYTAAMPATPVPPATTSAPFDGWSLEDTPNINTISPNLAQPGDDLLLTDVVSFDVKVLQQGYPGFGGIPIFMDLPPAVPTTPLPPASPTPLTPSTVMNPGFTPMNIAAAPAVPPAYFSVFDTWSKNLAPVGSTTPSYGDTNPAITTGSRRAYWDGRPGDPDATTNTRQAPLRIRIVALQITIRVWDEKTEQSRQVTIIQDM